MVILHHEDQIPLVKCNEKSVFSHVAAYSNNQFPAVMLQ